MDNDHKEIWLGPDPDAPEAVREWYEYDVFSPSDYDGKLSTKYIRADLYEKLEEEKRKLLSHIETWEIGRIDEQDCLNLICEELKEKGDG